MPEHIPPSAPNPIRRLTLDALDNCRELGGFPVPGGVTRFGVFLRSDAPCGLTARDLAALRKYGVASAVDLRGDAEIDAMPSSLAGLPDVTYFRADMFDDAYSRGETATLTQKEFIRWGGRYVEMLKNGRRRIGGALTFLSEQSGCALFHCRSGKDRAGLIAALVLGLAGVSDEDIAADYCVSELYLQRGYATAPDGSRIEYGYKPTIPDSPYFRTEPASMYDVLDFIHGECGGFRGYAESCGVTDGAVDVLREKLISFDDVYNLHGT
jgi:protein-tyrosine phosphatase